MLYLRIPQLWVHYHVTTRLRLQIFCTGGSQHNRGSNRTSLHLGRTSPHSFHRAIFLLRLYRPIAVL